LVRYESDLVYDPIDNSASYLGAPDVIFPTLKNLSLASKQLQSRVPFYWVQPQLHSLYRQPFTGALYVIGQLTHTDPSTLALLRLHPESQSYETLLNLSAGLLVPLPSAFLSQVAPFPQDIYFLVAGTYKGIDNVLVCIVLVTLADPSLISSASTSPEPRLLSCPRCHSKPQC
jgi:hypothetical protein